MVHTFYWVFLSHHDKEITLIKTNSFAQKKKNTKDFALGFGGATVGRLTNIVLTVARGVGFAEVPLRDLYNEIEDENLVDGIAERVRNVERMMRASRDWQGRTGAVVTSISEGLG